MPAAFNVRQREFLRTNSAMRPMPFSIASFDAA
mgnify:CR=1 FL=1